MIEIKVNYDDTVSHNEKTNQGPATFNLTVETLYFGKVSFQVITMISLLVLVILFMLKIIPVMTGSLLNIEKETPVKSM